MLHMHEVTGSSPVVPTTKKGRLLPSFFVRGRRRTSRPREKNDETAEQGAGSRGTPRRGVPLGGVGGALLSPPQKKEGFCLFFVRRRRRTSRPREKNDETAEQGAGSRGTPRRGVPLGGVGGALLSPPEKTIWIAPFCGRACRSFFPQSPFPFSDDQPPLTTSKGAAFFHIYAQSFGMLANPFARSSSVGI